MTQKVASHPAHLSLWGELSDATETSIHPCTGPSIQPKPMKGWPKNYIQSDSKSPAFDLLSAFWGMGGGGGGGGWGGDRRGVEGVGWGWGGVGGGGGLILVLSSDFWFCTMMTVKIARTSFDRKTEMIILLFSSWQKVLYRSSLNTLIYYTNTAFSCEYSFHLILGILTLQFPKICWGEKRKH